MGLFDFFKKETKKTLQWVINPSGQWIYPSGSSNDYIRNGYKELPNVYAIITALLKKSTAVPFEIYKMKNGSKYRKYSAKMANARTSKDYADCLRLKSESLEKVENSEIERLLLNPNTYQSREQLMWEVDGYKLLTGNSFLYGIAAMEGGKPKELHNIPSPFVTMQVDGSPFDPNIEYKISYLANTIPGSEISHFKYWNPITGYANMYDHLMGQSPLMACRMLLGKYKDADLTQGFMFKNQGPAGLLTGKKDSDLEEEQAQAIKDRFDQLYRRGASSANDIIVTPVEMGWESIGLSPVDLNIKEGKKEILGELCNAYNVPIGMFSDTNSTENNMVESRKAFITDAVIPLVESRKQEEQRSIVNKFGDEYRIEYDYTIFHELQEDIHKLAETAEKMYWITPNEKRAMTGYDQDTDPMMNEKYFPSGLVPLEDLNMDIGNIDESKLTGRENPNSNA